VQGSCGARGRHNHTVFAAGAVVVAGADVVELEPADEVPVDDVVETA
jgi:hypothetical protein